MSAEQRQIVLKPIRGAAPGVGTWIAALNDGRRRTMEVLEGIDPGLLDAAAPHHQHTIGTLLYHIALIEADWLYVEIREEDYPDDIVEVFPWDVRDEERNLTAVEGVPLDAHLERLSYVRQRLIATLMDLSDDEFNAPRTIPNAVVSTAWVVHHLLQHEAEHRGEIGQILDALGHPRVT